jgi:hypothetical protein
MAETEYIYTKTGVIPHILQAEIMADIAITTSIMYALLNHPDDLRVVFADALSGAEKTELDYLISIHPQAIPEEEGSTDIATGGYPAGYCAISDGASGTQWISFRDAASGVVDHATLDGLGGDDHSQYHNDTRGDVRYYTQTQLNNGQLDAQYYTESEVNVISGALDTKLTTHKSSADHDSRYYTEIEVNTISGALSAEIDSDIATHTALPNAHHNRSHAMTSTSDHSSGNYKVFYSTAAGQVAELALSTSGTVLTAQGASAAPVFAVPSAVTGVSGIQGGGTLDNNRTLSLDINGLTRDTVPNVDDYVATYETSTGTHKKVSLGDTSLVVASGSYFYEESDGESGTSSTTYQDKTILSASGIISGTYRLLYTCEYQAGANNKDVAVRVFDATVSGVYAENSQQTNNNQNWFTLSGFKRLTLSAGTRDIRWQYRAGTTSIVIRRARLELRRVS